MENKFNTDDNFFSDEIDLEDFYLSSSSQPRKSESNYKKEGIRTNLFPSTASFSKNNKDIDLAGMSFQDSGNCDNLTLNEFAGVTTPSKKMENLNNSDDIRNEDIIDEILEIDINKYSDGNKRIISSNDKVEDESVDVNVQSALNMTNLDDKQFRGIDSENLQKLDKFKKDLDNATKSFSQISDSIEILSGDINGVNENFLDCLDTDKMMDKQKKNDDKFEFGDHEYSDETSKKQRLDDDASFMTDILEPTSKNFAQELSVSCEVKSADSFDNSQNDSPLTDRYSLTNFSVDDAKEQTRFSFQDLTNSDKSTDLGNGVSVLSLPKKNSTPEDFVDWNSCYENMSLTTFSKKDMLDGELFPVNLVDTPVDNSSTEQDIKVSFVDYSNILSELKHQAVLQVQDAVQTEMERLRSEKIKFEEEIRKFNQDRNTEISLSQLNERFSSLVGPFVSFANDSSRMSKIADVPSEQDISNVEMERRKILNSTKNLIEKYELSEHAKSEELPEKISQVNTDCFYSNKDSCGEVGLNVIADELSLIKKEVLFLKEIIQKEKLAKATEKLKAKIISDSKSEEKKLDELIEEAVTKEFEQQVETSILSNDDAFFDSLDEMRNSLCNRQIGNEVEEQNRLYEMEKIRNELKNEILDELNLFKSSRKFNDISNEDSSETVNNWLDQNETNESSDSAKESVKNNFSRSANLVFSPSDDKLRGRDLILKYVRELTKKKLKK